MEITLRKKRWCDELWEDRAEASPARGARTHCLLGGKTRLLTPRGRKRKKVEDFVVRGFPCKLSTPPLSVDMEWSWTCLGEEVHPAFWEGAVKHSCWKHQSVCFLAEGDGHVQGEILEWRALSRAGPRDENRVWSMSAAHTVHMCVGKFHLVGHRVPEHPRWLLPGILWPPSRYRKPAV